MAQIVGRIALSHGSQLLMPLNQWGPAASPRAARRCPSNATSSPRT